MLLNLLVFELICAFCLDVYFLYLFFNLKLIIIFNDNIIINLHFISIR
jgi:hypothetical protein